MSHRNWGDRPMGSAKQRQNVFRFCYTNTALRPETHCWQAVYFRTYSLYDALKIDPNTRKLLLLTVRGGWLTLHACTTTPIRRDWHTRRLETPPSCPSVCPSNVHFYDVTSRNNHCSIVPRRQSCRRSRYKLYDSCTSCGRHRNPSHVYVLLVTKTNKHAYQLETWADISTCTYPRRQRIQKPRDLDLWRFALRVDACRGSATDLLRAPSFVLIA